MSSCTVAEAEVNSLTENACENLTLTVSESDNCLIGANSAALDVCGTCDIIASKYSSTETPVSVNVVEYSTEKHHRCSSCECITFTCRYDV